MMPKRYWLRPGLFAAAMALSPFAPAASLVNGGFDTGLSGWSAVTNGGTVQWDPAGQAVLATGPDAAAYSSVLVQGDDGAFSFADPIVLGANDNLFKFDFSFGLLGADALESVSGTAMDNLQVWLYDAAGLGDVLMTTLNALSVGSSFTFNLSPYISHAVAFSFELNDENDGVNTRVSLDNIRTERGNPVPLPGTLALQLIGLAALVPGWRRTGRGNRSGKQTA